MATLQQFMDNQAEDNVVYSIGSSTRYLFIGTKDEYNKLIKHISNKHINYLRYRFNSTKHTLEYKKNHKPNKPIKVKVWQFGKRIEKEISVKEQVAEWGKEIDNLKRIIANYDSRIKTFVEFPDRKIISYYSRIDETDGKILVIEGKEEGAYWFRYEFQKDYKI